MSAVPDATGEPSATRSFVDADGQRWTVAAELAPRTDWTASDEDTHRSGYPVGWLWFTCDAMRRRLRLFPSHWFALADAELERLCRRALRVD